MPSYKQQHYVPKCYLRGFAIDNGKKGIHVFNIQRVAMIFGASIKGQCSSKDFYGSNLELEKSFQGVETIYGHHLTKTIKQPLKTDKPSLQFFREFSILQYFRTYAAKERVQLMHETMQSEIFDGRTSEIPEDFKLSGQDILMLALSMYTSGRKVALDLEKTLVINRTKFDFLTSDDPIVMANKFHDIFLNTSNFGLGSSGTLLWMPLTPRLAFLAYDKDVYYSDSKSGNIIEIKNRRDVASFNELTVLKSHENLYFSNWDKKQQVLDSFENCSDERPENWHTAATFVPHEKREGGEVYRRANDSERITASESLVTVSMFYPRPSRWPKTLKIKSSPETFSNGSAIGHVRKAIWNSKLSTRDYR